MKDGFTFGLILLGVGVIAGLAVAFMFMTPEPAVGALSLRKPATQMNEEVWRWKDWKGREREITVHRKVKIV